MVSQHVFRMARRQLSSNRVGSIIRKPKLEPQIVNMDGPLDPVTSVTPETKMKNIALATTLSAFCVGVALYSMNAVGQAGSGSDDPLAALRQEAAAAQEKHDRENRKTDDATEMLKQFRAGDYDPDKYDELDETEKPKRPWWKLW